jgi:hypothetical protein
MLADPAWRVLGIPYVTNHTIHSEEGHNLMGISSFGMQGFLCDFSVGNCRFEMTRTAPLGWAPSWPCRVFQRRHM